MNKRQAKRHACWLAARIVDTTMCEGAELYEGSPEDEQRVTEALEELIDELHKRSRLYWISNTKG